MIRFLLVTALLFSLVGCGLFPTRTEYVDKVVPVYTVPTPPVIERPELPIHAARYNILSFVNNPENFGRIVQDYTISVRLLLNYSEANEAIVSTYRELSEQEFSPNNVPMFGGMSFDSPILMGNGNGDRRVFGTDDQVDMGFRARRAFAGIVDKYEKRKEEILNNETE